MKTKLLILSLILISSGMMAQRAIWQPGGDQNGAGDWANPDNWDTSIPGSELDGRAIFKGGECFVSSDVSTEALGLPGDYKVELGDNKDDNIAKLTIQDGGHVAALRASWSAVGIWSPAILIVEEGGSIIFGSHLWIGSTKSYDNGTAEMASEVHLNGGTITVNEMFGIDFYNDKEFSGGTLYMNGGLLDLAQWNPGNPDEVDANASLGKHGKIEYTDGLIQIAGNHKASLEWFRDNDQITGEFEIWVDSVITETDTTVHTKLSKYAPNNATLSELTVSEGTLAPAFDAATYDYTVELPSGTTATPTVTPTTGSVNATFDVTDAADVTSSEEADRTTTIVVTAEDGETTLTYSIVFNIATGVHDMSLNNLIYPNPASSRLYINHDVKIDRVEIFSITGSRVLIQNHIGTKAVDISELNSGLYFISVIDVNNNNIVRKFQKQ